MILKTPAIRLSIALALLTVNLLFLANQFGLIPDPSESVLSLRKGLSESLALQFAAAANNNQMNSIRNTLRAVVERNKDIRSAAIRTGEGQLIALVGEHLAHWRPPDDGKSTPTHIRVPVFRNNQEWAMVEIRFGPIWTDNSVLGFADSFVELSVFIGLTCFACYFFVLKRTLRELDPTAVIPERVQKAFDVLQEGVLILDKQEQILMTNKSFSGYFDKLPHAMVGLKASELGWLNCQTPEQARQLPWFKVMDEGQEHEGASLILINRDGGKIKFAVNATMVTDNDGAGRGTLMTFDDITLVEEKNFELNNTVEKLRLANEDIKAKSSELEILANCDPLTLCFNRRAFGLRFDSLFAQAVDHGTQLSCLMVDIDFFKAVNDNYGHATGDQVIKAVADILKTSTRDCDLVGRYGGEEFCVVLPTLALEKAAQIAERIRRTVEENDCSGINITISIGVSSLEVNSNNPDEMVDQADKALYAAKKGGRNRVVCWGKDPDSSTDVEKIAASDDEPSHDVEASPYETDHVQLQRRIKELEGLLEKRTLELEHYEMYDFKTGLPNRSLFEDRIAHEIARGKRKNCLVAVLSMTINTIKQVHESLGYKAAEQLVKICGRRLNAVLCEDMDTVAVMERENGMSTVSLINQTEFGVLLTDIQQADHVTWVMKRLLDAFKKPFTIAGNEIYASVYFGVGIYPHDGHSVEELYASAANACHYACKINGKERYLFASPQLNEKVVNQLEIESSLHKAIESDEMQLHYQPKIDSKTGQIAGFEALLRWQSNSMGFVPPNLFIPIAERSGQIDEIGDWVLFWACQQLRSWMDKGLAIKPIAVNMSGLQLRQPNLSHRIQEILDEFRIDNHLLEIELTESALVNTTDQSLSILNNIREMGVRVSMDDFGTGYSSLSYLRDIPLSCLKIDRSFIADIGVEKKADQLIASIIAMAHGLGLDVVAEGVEEKYHVDYLTELGCEYLQGDYFSRPLPPQEAVSLIDKQPMMLAG